MRPRRWSERAWNDVSDNWQFRTFRNSKRNFNVVLSVVDMQGDGFFHLNITAFGRALAFEFAFDGNKHQNPRIEWKLIK